MQLGLAAYSFAALAFLALTLLIKPDGWKLGSPGLRLWIASALSVLWAAICAFHAARDAISDAGLWFLDVMQLAVWVWALSAIGTLQGLPKGWLRLTKGTAFSAASLALLLLAGAQNSPNVFGYTRAIILLGLILSLIGVLSIEQVYRNATQGTRSALRWLAIGVGGSFVVSLFMFAEATLTREINWEVWLVRGLLFGGFAVPIAVGTRRLDQAWVTSVFVSRQVMFYTTSFMLVGAYLLLMSLGGFYLRASGGVWGRSAQVFFLTVAALLLGVIIFSGTLRRRIFVWLTKSFYRHRYDYRAEWLRFIRTLSEQPQQRSIQQAAIVSVAQIIGSERGVLWTRNDSAQQFLPAASWPDALALSDLPILAASDSLVGFMAHSGWVVDLRELRDTPSLYDDLRVEPAISQFDRDAIILPLLHREQMYGVLALGRPGSLQSLNFEDRDLLKTVGRHLAAHLSQDDADRRLAESRQFEAYNRFTAFVMHDLKNLAAQLQLVVHNAERHKRNPEFVDDAIATIANSVDRMSRLLAQLTRGDSAEHRRDVDLAEIIQRVVTRVANRQPIPRPVVSTAPRVQADPERVAMMLDHVLRNAQDATAETGEVRIELDVTDDSARVRVIDDGVGMDESFVRERLFRPFDTTKGSKGMGIGAYQVREYMRSLGGDVAVSSAPGRGTCISLLFPARQAMAATQR